MNMKEIKPYVEAIHNNNKSEVIVVMYDEEDYWQSKEAITTTYYDVDDACIVWQRTPHPHKPYSNALAIIQDLKSRPFPLYCIKSIEVKVSD